MAIMREEEDECRSAFPRLENRPEDVEGKAWRRKRSHITKNYYMCIYIYFLDLNI